VREEAKKENGNRDIVFINDKNYTTEIKIQNTLRDLFRIPAVIECL